MVHQARFNLYYVFAYSLCLTYGEVLQFFSLASPLIKMFVGCYTKKIKTKLNLFIEIFSFELIFLLLPLVLILFLRHLIGSLLQISFGKGFPLEIVLRSLGSIYLEDGTNKEDILTNFNVIFSDTFVFSFKTKSEIKQRIRFRI